MLGRQIRQAEPASVGQSDTQPSDGAMTNAASDDTADDGASAEVGREIINPVSGERIIIRQSGAQTGGKLLAFDLYLPPGGHVPARHAHPAQQETFTVVEGQMRFRLGWRTIIAQPGQTITIPTGVAHWFGAVGTEVAHARVEVRPALRMQEMFETTEALASETSHTRGAWLTRLANLASIVLEFQHEVAVPDVPAPLVRLALAPLAMLGRRRASTAANR